MTKLEEVARALRKHWTTGMPWEPDWIDNPELTAKWFAFARVAIEALREPDEAMTEAGLKGAIAGVGGCWRAMVDAALAEKA